MIGMFTSLRSFTARPYSSFVGPTCAWRRRQEWRRSCTASAHPESNNIFPIIHQPEGESLAPGLYLVGTPIGNLEDISFRALRVLRAADRILCEDTRVTSKLLNYYGIRTPLESYHQHNERSKGGKVISLLQQNAAIALVSDAGMPCINDPGAELVAAAAAAGLPVTPIPGPSSVLAALVGSGLPTERFMFCGYTPPKRAARKKLFEELQGEAATLLFFVSPHALLACLEDACAVLGPQRQCCVARELTKVYEEFWRGTLGGALAEFGERGPRGEVTLVVAGAVPQAAGQGSAGDEEVLEALQRAQMEEGLPPSQAAREVARRLNLPRKRVYGLSVAAGKLGGPEERGAA